MEIDGLTTTVELHDLGKIRQEWAGILSPLYGDDTVERYIHEQFLGEASHYVENYQSVAYWTSLLRNTQPSLPSKAPEKILDIGSGAGNTIFGLLELYPEASIVASDLSIPLLQMLKQHYDSVYGDSRNCAVVQLNAEDIVFEPDQFDLVVGGAILHHLFTPELTLVQCHKVLKPGGCAVFFEPFEIGYKILALALRQIVQINEYIPSDYVRLPVKLVEFFTGMANEFDVRTGSDKSNEAYQHIDDKWLFTRAYFEKVCHSIGFRELILYPIHSVERQFSNQLNTFLHIGCQTDFSTLPPWVRDYVTMLDQQFSPEVRQEMIIEGCVILKK